jgi:hypothetical protein
MTTKSNPAYPHISMMEGQGILLKILFKTLSDFSMPERRESMG